MGECADRDHVDAAFGYGCNGFESDAAGGFGEEAALDAGDGFAEPGGCHIVEQDDIGTLGEDLVELVERVDLDFDFHEMADGGFYGAKGGDDAACDRDVVVFDQDRVIEAEAVVEAAAAQDGIFLEGAEAGRRFAGADDAGFGVGDGCDIARCQRGDAGKATEEIQRDALGGEEGAGGAFNGRKDRAGGDGCTIRDAGFKTQGWIEQAEGGFREIKPRDNARLARGNDGAGLFHRGNGGVGGDVAGAAEIFEEGGADGVFDEEGIEHDQAPARTALTMVRSSVTVRRERWARVGTGPGKSERK